MKKVVNPLANVAAIASLLMVSPAAVAQEPASEKLPGGLSEAVRATLQAERYQVVAFARERWEAEGQGSK